MQEKTRFYSVELKIVKRTKFIVAFHLFHDADLIRNVFSISISNPKLSQESSKSNLFHSK